MQTQKWVNWGLLVAAVSLFLFVSKLAATVWEMGRFPIPEAWPVEPSYLVSFIVAGSAGFLVRKNEKANRFLNEVTMELSRVSWPARKETVASAGVVVVLLGLSAAILSLIDLLWGTTIRGILAL